MKKILTISTLLFGAVLCMAKSGDYRFAQTAKPEDFSIYQDKIGVYFSGKSVYSMLNLKVCTVGGPIRDIEINPTGISVAVIWGKEKTNLSIYDLYDQDKRLAKPKLQFNPLAVTYSFDGKTMFLSDDTGCIHVLESKTFAQTGEFKLDFVPDKILASPNGDFLAVSNGSKLQVRIVKDGSLRKELDLGEKINDFAFAPDNSFIAILLAGGTMMEYETATFLPGNEIDALGISRNIAVHKDNKYIAVVSADNVVAIVNRMNSRDRDYVKDTDNGVNRPAFPSQPSNLLAYNTQNSVVWHQLQMILPNYHKLIAEEVERKMEEWVKQMPGETLEAYQERVNEETRARQMALFEEEIATKLAEGQLEAAQVSLGSYNAEEGLLSLTFDSMPSIFLSVPGSKLGSFADVNDLRFENARYGVTPDDKFELIYVEVYNIKTGATFVFDNRERKSLEYLRSSDSFVPLSIMQLSNMEELMLEEIKESVVKNAKDRNVISQHTNIDVSTKVTKDIDAYGKKILNYDVEVKYDVEEEYSVREDFGPGKYLLEDSHAAQAMTEILKNAFEGDFSQYIKAGKKIRVAITGMADMLKIHNRIEYSGVYGEFVDEPVFYGDGVSAITVTTKTGITGNEQLAFIRAAGVKQYVENNIPAFSQADTQYEYHITVSDEEGGAARRITVKVTFYDAF